MKRIVYLILIILLCLIWIRAQAQDVNKKTDTNEFKGLAVRSIDDCVDTRQAIKTIKHFYTAYTADRASLDSIKQRYLTKRLIDKLQRVGSATDSDPIIRAQDFISENLHTLLIIPLREDWFKVHYKVTYDKSSVDIPLKIIKSHNQYKIDYLTPEWNGTLYGDSLLTDIPITIPIDTVDPLLFLKTFYEAYCSEYGNMPEGLTNRLRRLKTQFCTEKALEQFEKAVKEQKQDGRPGYDLLIDNFDFDKMWLPSITYKQINEKEYEVFYKGNQPSTTIRLDIIKQRNCYRINGIKTN